MTDTLRPADAHELREAIAEAASTACPLEPRAGGSKHAIGTPERGARILDLGALAGIVDYEPSELVLTARPSTPLADVETLLASHGQMLAFEPWDHGPLFDRPAGAATIGGVIAAGVAGSRRVSAGGARDHLLGFEAVSGRAEIFRGGGKVVKNVTGYDVSKVIAGSWGQLAIMTELTLKIAPRARHMMSLRIEGLEPAAAIAAMAKAMGSPCAIAAAAHLPRGSQDRPVTVFRLEGFRESVEARARQLCDLLSPIGAVIKMPDEDAGKMWEDIQHGQPVSANDAVWRTHIAPSRAAAFASAVEQAGGYWFLDWAGALAWVGASGDCDVRALAAAFDGHATLLSGPHALRVRTPARQTEPGPIAALSARLKRAFDPAGVLDPLRFA